MSHVVRFVAALISMLAAAMALHAQAGLKIADLMTAAEYQRCGLQKLTDAERAALDAWVNAFARQVLATTTTTRMVPAGSAIDFASLEGALIIADDGQLLGKITTNPLDSQSLLNTLGRHGSELSSTSIFNELSRYGGEISSLSPFNSLSSTPPKIFKGNAFLGYLTTNRIKSPRIDPYALVGWLKSQQ